MKLTQLIVTTAVACQIASVSANALTVAVSDDTFSASDGMISKLNGKATSLPITSKKDAFIQFPLLDTGAVPLTIQPGNIVSATLRIYFPTVTTKGNLTVHQVTSEWNEKTNGPEPTFDAAPVATIDGDAVIKKGFAVVDVTQSVKDALALNTPNNGFAIVSDGTAVVAIGAKEGTGNAYPATLEIEANYADDGSGNTFVPSLLTAGQAGIGTSNPLSLLQVGEFGGATDNYITVATQGGNTQRAGIKLRHFDSDYGFTIESDERGASYGLNFLRHFDDPAGISTLFLGIDGNVGIGTISPQGRLDIALPDVAGGINSNVRFREDGGVAGLTIAGGTTAGTLRFRNNFEVWPNSGGSTAGKLDVRNTAGIAQVTLNGDGTVFKPGGGSWGVSSDVRLKKNIADLDGALDRLLQLRSVTYEYIDPRAIHELPGRQTGFIAQEAERIFPEWVGEKDGGYKFVAPKGFESLSVQALRELRAEKDSEIKSLKAEIAQLKADAQAREERLARLESLLPSAGNAPRKPVALEN